MGIKKRNLKKKMKLKKLQCQHDQGTAAVSAKRIDTQRKKKTKKKLCVCRCCAETRKRVTTVVQNLYKRKGRKVCEWG